jgi:hypothetical protein
LDALLLYRMEREEVIFGGEGSFPFQEDIKR